jgi:hypothetical protein
MVQISNAFLDMFLVVLVNAGEHTKKAECDMLQYVIEKIIIMIITICYKLIDSSNVLS